MADVIGQQLRREVSARAGGRCEYCLMDETLLVWGCEVDHIISRKHGGATESSNPALSCARCNRAKGTDIASLDGWIRRFQVQLLMGAPISFEKSENTSTASSSTDHQPAHN